jgi:glutamine synthetase
MSTLTDHTLAAGVALLRVAYCDNANLIRAKAVPASGVAGAERYGVGFSVAQQALPMMGDVVLPDTGLAPAGEVYLMPDPATFAALPYSPGSAMVVGDFVTADGHPWEHCPRSALKRAAAAAAAVGLSVRAAFEPEFYFLKPSDGGWAPIDDTNFAMTSAFDMANELVLDLVEALDRVGLDLQMIHPESGPGQFEVSIHHADPVTAADRHVLLRETVRGVALRHGMAASFAAKPFPDKVGSGCHLHMSLWRDGRNVLHREGDPLTMSDLGYQWTAGLLAHIDGLCALTVPSVNSYLRLRPHYWAGAYACYGRDNREAAVRVITPRRGAASMNLELKVVDSSANPYLALAGAIAAGLDGVRRGLHPGAPVEVDPATLSEEERASRKIRQLPDALGDALDALARDDVLRAALGGPLARSYIGVRRGEWDALRELPPAVAAQQHLLRY